MTRFSLPVLLMISLLVAGCSEDSKDQQIRHYYYPVWSNDASFIIASYEETYGDPGAPRQEIFQLALRNNIDRTENIFSVGPGVAHARYFITPENNAVAVLLNGLEFYSLTGRKISEFTSSTLGISPTALTFDSDQNAIIWAARTNETVHIVRTVYDDKAWEPTNESIIRSFENAGSDPIDIRITGQNSIVVALEEGRIIEYPFVGDKLSEFNYEPYPQENAWLRRIEYTFDDRANASYVYTLNNAGLVRFDLTNNHDSLIVDGQGKYVVGFDAADSTDTVVFEVSDGDIYNYKPALFRRAAAHRMPKFSPNGERIVAVAFMDAGRDSLRIFR